MILFMDLLTPPSVYPVPSLCICFNVYAKEFKVLFRTPLGVQRFHPTTHVIVKMGSGASNAEGHRANTIEKARPKIY